MNSKATNGQMTHSAVSTPVNSEQAPAKKIRTARVKKAQMRKGGGIKKEPTAIRGAPKTISERKKLVCRYCGSDDLSPSFIERRDARCRACFKKRYGSSARSRKTKASKAGKASK
jgi:hypothetical protein